MNKLLEAALSYTELGFFIIPLHSPRNGICSCNNRQCSSPCKHPRIKDWPNSASTDEQVIREWWSRWPDANIGILTGRKSGILVLDVDGEEGLKSLSRFPQIEPTVTSRTGRGCHYCFGYPNSYENVRNFVRKLPGLDLRGDGGFIVAPPSRHINGTEYAWQIPSWEQPPSQLPDWLFKLIFQEDNGPKTASISNSISHPVPENGKFIYEGERNTTLTSEAGRLRNQGLEAGAIYNQIQNLNSTKCKPPLPDTEVQTIAESIAKYPAVNVEDFSKLTAPEMANILGSEIRYIFTAEHLYRFANGVFIPDGKDVTEKTLFDKLGKKYTSRVAGEVVHCLEVMNKKDCQNTIQNQNLINLANGLLYWEDLQLRPHSSAFESFCQIPVRYDPEATCPEIDKFFESILPPECIPLIEELFGYCLLPDTRFEKAFMLVGSGQNGKSTLLKLLVHFLGPDNVSNIPLQELTENRFARAGLFGKLANIFSDLDRRALKETAYFKMTVSGDPMQAEQKYKNPFFFRPYARLIFSANELPPTLDLSPAFFRRWIILPFEKQFEGRKADKNLLAKLTTAEEMSGLLNRALKGLTRLSANGAFSESVAMDQAKAEYRLTCDSVVAFVTERIEEASNSWKAKREVYAAYVKYCSDCGLSALSRNKFNRRLRDACPAIRELRKDGKVRAWQGIRIVDEEPLEVRSYREFDNF